MEPIDVAIVGGGAVGLAAACAVAERLRSVCVFERHPRPGLEGSTHNSGVIHAGIYYPPGSLKARLCVEGREDLYRFCEQHDVPHARCGKLIVAASDDEVPALEALVVNGRANGVSDLEIVDRAFVRRREPHVEAAAAIWSPSTGIIEAETLVRALAHRATRAGAHLLPGTFVDGGRSHAGAIELRTAQESVAARVVVNAAGLHADDLSARLGGEALRVFPVRGEYAELVPPAGRLVTGLIYPLPDPGGHTLGVHLTRTTRGAVWLGPTARYQTAKDDYELDRLPLSTFADAARRLIPAITLDDLRPGPTGIRACGSPPGAPVGDFIVRRDRDLPTLIHAAGIDSPGLTSCLAIGRLVADLVDETLA